MRSGSTTGHTYGAVGRFVAPVGHDSQALELVPLGIYFPQSGFMGCTPYGQGRQRRRVFLDSCQTAPGVAINDDVLQAHLKLYFQLGAHGNPIQGYTC